MFEIFINLEIEPFSASLFVVSTVSLDSVFPIGNPRFFIPDSISAAAPPCISTRMAFCQVNFSFSIFLGKFQERLQQRPEHHWWCWLEQSTSFDRRLEKSLFFGRIISFFNQKNMNFRELIRFWEYARLEGISRHAWETNTIAAWALWVVLFLWVLGQWRS